MRDEEGGRLISSFILIAPDVLSTCLGAKCGRKSKLVVKLWHILVNTLSFPFHNGHYFLLFLAALPEWVGDRLESKMSE